MRRHTLLIAALSTALLAACGGGSSDDTTAGTPVVPAVTAGALTGPVISGLDYGSCNSEGCVNVGTTDTTGAFTHQRGRDLVFSVGQLEFFRTAATTTGRLLTLSATGDEKDAAFLNKMSLLYTIDEDGTPANGIQLSTLARNTLRDKVINFSQTADAFLADSTVQSVVTTITSGQAKGAQPLYAPADVQATLTKLYFDTQYAGEWQFYFDGVDKEFSTVVDASGQVTGAGAAGKAGDRVLRAQVEYTSALKASVNGGVPGEMSVIGTFNADGTAQGQYTVNEIGAVVTGSWTAKKGPKPEKNS